MDKGVHETMIVIQRSVQTAYVQVMWVKVIGLRGLRVYFEGHALTGVCQS